MTTYRTAEVDGIDIFYREAGPADALSPSSEAHRRHSVQPQRRPRRWPRDRATVAPRPPRWQSSEQPAVL